MLSARIFTDSSMNSHTTRSMASIGIHTNGSQFYMALTPMPHLNGRCVVFARIVKGTESLAAVEKVRHGTLLT